MATATTTAAGSAKGRGAGRFAAACGVLSQYVKAAATVAPQPAPAVVALPLMPGADVSTAISSQEEQEPAAGCASASTRNQSSSSQMSIFYGGRVLVLDDVPADRAADVLRLAANGVEAAPCPRGLKRAAGDDDLMPVARKASLQRFMEKRRSRVVAARASAAPYSRPDDHGDGACSLTLSL